MAQAHCPLDTEGYKRPHSGCIKFIALFSTAAMVAGMRLNIMLYIHCLSCFSFLRSEQSMLRPKL